MEALAAPFLLAQILVEEINGTVPGQGRCGLVITGRCIVMEAVIDTIIDMGSVVNALRF